MLLISRKLRSHCMKLSWDVDAELKGRRKNEDEKAEDEEMEGAKDIEEE